jgi:propionyl-CoA synthetase
LQSGVGQAALIAVFTETSSERPYSLADLYAAIQCISAKLQELGVRRKGDQALIYMLMIVEAAFAMLASRTEDVEPVMVVSADASSRVRFVTFFPKTHNDKLLHRAYRLWLRDAMWAL